MHAHYHIVGNFRGLEANHEIFTHKISSGVVYTARSVLDHEFFTTD